MCPRLSFFKTPSVIIFDDVGKTYRGLTSAVRAVRAVDRFSLNVADGEVLGIAGPNGAGKSTLIAMLLGFQYPTSGQIRIDGLAPRAYVERYGVGYVPELMAFNPKWRTENALRRCAILSGVPVAQQRERVEAVIAQLGLEEHRGKRIKSLSKGTTQRVGIAQVLLCDERVIILDEPTHGLDPMWMLRFRDIVEALRAPNRIILIASHNLDELQRLADRVAIIDHGRLQRVVSTAIVEDVHGTVHYRVHVVAGAEHVARVFDSAEEVAEGEFEVESPNLAALNRGVAELVQRGGVIASLAPRRTALEAQFDVATESESPVGRRGARIMSHVVHGAIQ